MHLLDPLTVAFHRTALIRPCKNRAGHILHVLVTGLLQLLRESTGAITDRAIGNDGLIEQKVDRIGRRIGVDSLRAP